MRPRHLLLAVVSGLAVGVGTSFGQTYLDGALNAFVNSASAWLVAPFAVGAYMATRRNAAVAGFAVCFLQLVGYYVTSNARGFAAGTAILAFWTVCALVGGPIFGAAGYLWRHGPGSLRGLGGAVLAAAFLAEGLWVYLHVLGYRSTAALWIGIGLVLALAPRHRLARLKWLALTLPAGILAEIVLAQVYAQSF